MAHVLIRDLDADTVQRLKARARRNGRSLQAELKSMIERGASTDPHEAREIAKRIRARLTGRPLSDSGDLQAKVRLG